MGSRLIFCFVLFLLIGCFAPVCSAASSSPSVYTFSDETIPVDIGEVRKVIISVRNNDDFVQEITVKLSSAVANDPIGNWIWFEGHRYDTSRKSVTLSFDAYEKKNIGFNVMGGISGGSTKQINVEAKPVLGGVGTSSDKIIKVHIFKSQSIFYNQVPGSAVWVICFVLFAGLIVVFRKFDDLEGL